MDLARRTALLQFLDQGVTSLHVAGLLGARLTESGFINRDTIAPHDWPVDQTGWIRRGGAVLSYLPAADASRDRAPLIIAAHSDSPGLRLKPRSATFVAGGIRVPVELYGSPLTRSWFDRELLIAGATVDAAGRGPIPFRTQAPVACIPSVASHLVPRDERSQAPDPQRDLALLVPTAVEEGDAPEALLALVAREAGIEMTDPPTMDLRAVSAGEAHLIGREGALLLSPRLDNLLGCFTTLEAVRAVRERTPRPIVALFFDHEEIGSGTATGARGAVLISLARAILSKLGNSAEGEPSLPAGGIVVSNDCAHAIHPNRPDRSDPGYAPRPGGGAAIKESAMGRYSDDLVAVAQVERACRQQQLPLQWYRNRSDHIVGSTVGPHVARRLGLPAVDIGVPLLGMHSARESAAPADVESLISVLAALAGGEW